MAGFFNKSEWKAKTTSLPLFPKCGACGLFKQCNTPKMPHSGTGKHKILFVGEAPSEQDDEDGLHFSGREGQQLRATLETLGIDLEDCWMTYAAICHPKDGLNDKHILYCRPNITKTIRDLKPKVVIPLGHLAVKSLLAPEWDGGGESVGSMQRWEGWHIPSHSLGCWVCPVNLFTPATARPGSPQEKDNAIQQKLFRRSLKSAIRMQRYTGPSSESPLARLRRQISVYVDPRDTRKRLRRLSDASGRLAFDFETNSLKPENIKRFIHTVAFSFEGADTWAGRIDETCLPALSEVLKNKQTKKIASNLKFEERWSRAKLGHGVASWYWDTMLAAHVLDNRPEISSVKFQAYVRLGVPDYASAIHIWKRLRITGRIRFWMRRWKTF